MALRVAGFDGKLVFITGGSSGIGLETAKLLATQGAHIVIFGRSREKLRDATAAIEDSTRNREQNIAGLSLDVSDHRQVSQVTDEACRSFGVPDILINCAGRAVPHYFEDISYEMFDQTMKTNLYGQWNMCASLVPRMKAKGGYIVNVASMAAFIGIFGYTDYAASKYASLGFSEVLRSELKASGIGVSVLCPPDTQTPGFEEENRTKPPETVAASEGGGVIQPSQVAAGLLRGMRKGTFVIIPSREGRLIFMLKRLLPGLLEGSIASTIRKVQQKKSEGGRHDGNI